MVSPQNEEESRSLRNTLSNLNIQIANLDSNFKKLLRQKEAHQLRVRRLSKEIRRKEVELSELQEMKKEFDKKEFEIVNDKRLLKKKVEATMAKLRTVNSVS